MEQFIKTRTYSRIAWAAHVFTMFDIWILAILAFGVMEIVIANSIEAFVESFSTIKWVYVVVMMVGNGSAETMLWVNRYKVVFSGNPQLRPSKQVFHFYGLFCGFSLMKAIAVLVLGQIRPDVFTPNGVGRYGTLATIFLLVYLSYTLWLSRKSEMGLEN